MHTHTDTHSQAVGRSVEEGLKAWQRQKSVWRRGGGGGGGRVGGISDDVI